MTAAFDLTDIPREVTRRYVSPAYKAPDLMPPPEECSHDELLDLAAQHKTDASELPQNYAAAICRLLVEQFEPRLRAALDRFRESMERISGLEAMLRDVRRLNERLLSECQAAEQQAAFWRSKHAEEHARHTNTIGQLCKLTAERIGADK